MGESHENCQEIKKMKPVFMAINILCIVTLFSVQWSTLTIKNIYSNGIFQNI